LRQKFLAYPGTLEGKQKLYTGYTKVDFLDAIKKALRDPGQ